MEEQPPSVTGTAVTRHCEDDDCGAPIHDARADARFCSNACRQRAYRRRAALAALTPERKAEIEAELSTAVDRLEAIIGAVTASSRNAERVDS